MINIDLKNKPLDIEIQGSLHEVSAEIQFLLECLYCHMLADKSMVKSQVKQYMLNHVLQAIERVDKSNESEEKKDVEEEK